MFINKIALVKFATTFLKIVLEHEQNYKSTLMNLTDFQIHARRLNQLGFNVLNPRFPEHSSAKLFLRAIGDYVTGSSLAPSKSGYI